MNKIKIRCDGTEWLYAPDEEYADYDGCKRFLQIIFPYRSKWPEDKKYPLVIFIPGSAWHRQEMYNSLPQYARLAERGFVFAAMQYRESDIAPFPAQIQDVHMAVKHLFTKAEQFHIDMSRIYLAGNSSGGHIALMTAFSKACGVFTELWQEEKDECPVSYDISGVIAESAPSDIMLCLSEPLPSWMKERPTLKLLGTERIDGHETLARRASCGTYISEDAALPPVLLLHGTEDDNVSVRHSRLLYQMLTAKGKEVCYYELDGAGHGGAVFWEDEVLDIIEKFIRG